jgi:GNAT superfamily N-acetyltransferase
MAIEVVPAAGRFDDLAVLIGPGPAARGACWCMSYREGTLDTPAREAGMRRLCAEPPGPGVLAYLDGEIAGWCSVAPRASHRRLMNSRTIPHVDDRPVWSIVCFVVRTGFRRRGVARALLDGALDFARDNGGEVIEGYPVDTGGDRIGTGAAYTGTTDLFEAAGFDRVVLTSAHTARLPRWLMRREL